MLSKQNAFDTVVKHRTNEYKDSVLADKLQAKYAEKPLYKRLAGAKLAVLILSYLANLASFLTCLILITYFLHLSLKPYFGANFSLVISGLIGFGASSIIEKLKRDSSNHFFIKLFRYQTFAKAAFCVLLFLTSASFCLSLLGGYEIPKIASSEISYSEPKLTDIQGIKNDYQVQIDKVREDKELYFDRNKYKGRLGGEKGLYYANFDTRISELQKSMELAILDAQGANKTLIEESKAKHQSKVHEQKSSVQNQSAMVGYIVIGFEVCFLLSMAFLQWLDFKTYVLFVSTGRIKLEGVIIGDNAKGNDPKGQENPNEEQPQPTSQTGVTNSQNLVITDTNESKPYILIEGYKDPVFTLSRINNFISSYQNKLNKWNARNSKGEASSEQKENILNNLSKWGKYAQQLRNLSNQKTQA